MLILLAVDAAGKNRKLAVLSVSPALELAVCPVAIVRVGRQHGRCWQLSASSTRSRCGVMPGSLAGQTASIRCIPGRGLLEREQLEQADRHPPLASLPVLPCAAGDANKGAGLLLRYARGVKRILRSLN